MFLTKKHISRRAFIRSSVGATFALPLLDAMVPAQTPLARTAAAPLQRFGFIYVPHGSIMKEWTPLQDGAGFEFSPILKPLERFRSQVNVLTGSDQQRRERPLGQHGDVAERDVSRQGQRDPAEHDGRPADRAAGRPGHDVPVDRAGDRGSLEPSRQLRRRLPLLVHEHDLVAHADAAAADGDQPARRLRADVRRRRRHRRGAAGAPGAEQQHPRRGRRERERPAARPRRARPRQAHRVSRQRA